jgi:hypothetical protein
MGRAVKRPEIQTDGQPRSMAAHARRSARAAASIAGAQQICGYSWISSARSAGDRSRSRPLRRPFSRGAVRLTVLPPERPVFLVLMRVGG